MSGMEWQQSLMAEAHMPVLQSEKSQLCGSCEINYLRCEQGVKLRLSSTESYTASLEPRRWAGTEKDSKETTGNDLYGVRNMFTYNREGSTLQRVSSWSGLLMSPNPNRLFCQDARLLETETTVTGGNNVLQGLKTLQVDTTYAEDSEGAFETKETDDGGFVSDVVISLR